MKKHSSRTTHHNKPYGPLMRFVGDLEGGFAIFVGLVAGLSFSITNRDVLIVNALIGIMVNALNAATIRYSNEHYLDELDGREKRSPFKWYFLPAAAEFVIYMTVSCAALIPLLFVRNLHAAVTIMVITCLIILFSVGAARGKMFGGHWLRDGGEIMAGGLIMITIGSLAGWLIAYAIQ